MEPVRRDRNFLQFVLPEAASKGRSVTRPHGRDLKVCRQVPFRGSAVLEAGAPVRQAVSPVSPVTGKDSERDTEQLP